MLRVLALAALLAAAAANTGLFTQRSRGRPLPLPAEYKSSESVLAVAAREFRFELADGSASCDVLEEAFRRYYALTFPGLLAEPEVRRRRSAQDPLAVWMSLADETLGLAPRPRPRPHPKPHPRPHAGDLPLLSSLKVAVTEACAGAYPQQDMQEGYTLEVSETGAVLSAKQVWGALRGLETFSQLVYMDSATAEYRVNVTSVRDAPRFSFRGFLIDTSRHFVPLPRILEFVEALAQNKMNVLHWHIVDDQSFPYESSTFPELAAAGAFHPLTHVYSQAEVKQVVEFARLRGVRVLPEFDTPGHSYSWGMSHRELLTECYSSGKPDGSLGPMDPTKDATFDFVNKLWAELAQVFPEQYLHLGGDEVPFGCWQSNPQVQAFVKAHNWTDYADLEQYYIGKVVDTTLKQVKRTPVVWQEVYFNDKQKQLDKSVLVDIWTGDQKKELAQVTGDGFQTILSACWYLNYISYGSDWPQYYDCDPQDFSGSASQKALVVGGEACMWGEYVDAANLIARSWPRASAVAERLWSPSNTRDHASMSLRLEEQRCRMLARGLQVEPVTGPGFCDVEFGTRDRNDWMKLYGVEAAAEKSRQAQRARAHGMQSEPAAAPTAEQLPARPYLVADGHLRP